MKTYDLIVIGTGSAMNTIEPYLGTYPEAKIAIIDKDPPGGICLTKGCIPTKLLVYPAEMIRTMANAKTVGVHLKVEKIDFNFIMDRMRSIVATEINSIRAALSAAENIDYYATAAEFIAPYRLKVEDSVIRSDMIFLCLGSRPYIPDIKKLDTIRYYTSDTILAIEELPESIAIVGGGYIAAEYGHFFSAMGSNVTIIGRNKQFLPEEEPEVSAVAIKKMSKHMTILTNHTVTAAEPAGSKKKKLFVRDEATGKEIAISADEILLAAGRTSNADILHPEKAGIQTDENGWIAVNEYLKTTQEGVWALGDAIGKHPFKHVANYESKVLYYNALLDENIKVDYHAIPHAVFTHPEIAAVGLSENQAIDAYGKERILIGFKKFEDTAKGEAMAVENYFIKVIVEQESAKILGAHIIGPQASLLIQEIITLMYMKEGTIYPITSGMHIHPALSEVVKEAFWELVSVDEYRALIKS